MRNIKQMASYISKELIAKGFVIQRLDAETTKSIYLKLDYGLCNSIRISDHAGKKEYSYKFNILKQMPEKSCQYHTNGEFPRNFYSFDMVDKLIEDVVARKNEQLMKYGRLIYQELQAVAIQDKTGNNRFWKKAKLVK